ncbi:MAG: hypothetical protein LBL76_01110 [Treponema sp.]|jgi:hypothetical protein|nr:hypothetical protein [Treponema sp.]
MKKGIIAVLCLLLIGSAAFTLDKAAGAGLLIGETFQGGSITENYYDYYSYTVDWTFNRTSFGAFAFFGLSQYLEFNFAFMHKAGEASVSTSDGENYTGGGPEPTSAVGLGIYGKYPIPLSDRFVFFPTAGLDFEFNFEENWWDDLWIRGGVGIDYFLGDTIFLRGHFIYGAAIPVGEDELKPDVGHGLLAKVGIGFMF